MDENENIPYQIDFPLGKIVSGRWKVTSRIGTGAYGVVYCVLDEKKPPNLAALKVELNEVENSVLKIEREVLDKLQDRRHTIRLFSSGKRSDYSYIVITLCGADLARLKQEKKISKFTESTTYRIGIHALYAVKQLHEVGYVHRDIKPQNLVIGGSEKDSRILYLIDFGMVRCYALPDELKDENGKPIKSERPKRWILRKARKKILLRGTMRYCSLNVHKRNEQGRADDIISLIYMLLEMRFSLPWEAAKREERLIALKEEFPTDTNLNKCEGMRDILQYLHSLKYVERPDYKFIYTCLMDVIKKRKWKFSEPYDWEEPVLAPTPPATSPSKKNDDSGKKKKETKNSAKQLPTNTASTSLKIQRNREAPPQNDREIQNTRTETQQPESTCSTAVGPTEKSVYSEYSTKTKQAKKEYEETSAGEEDLYPTTAASAFDFKPGDVPSGSSIQESKQGNSSRYKSVMSNYAPL